MPSDEKKSQSWADWYNHQVSRHPNDPHTKPGRARGGWRFHHRDKGASKRRRKQAQASKRQNRRG